MAGMTAKRRSAGVYVGGKKTHGMTRSPEYRAWRSMLSRCYRKKDISYTNYGGRGIKVCDRWRKSFEAFFADMGPRPSVPRHTLERKENDGNYCPENCRWATYKEQRNNARSSFLITIDGVTKTMTQWCEQTGVPLGIASARIHRMKWDAARAVTEPARAYRKK